MAEKLDSYLTYLILDIINKRDFIDYGVLVSHTQIFFDEDLFDIIIVSPYYFQYVNRNGMTLLDDFMKDYRFSEWVNQKYQEIIISKFERALGSGTIFDFIPPTPEIVIIETMDYEELKTRRKGLISRH